MNDKDFGFYVTGLFHSLNKDSIKGMRKDFSSSEIEDMLASESSEDDEVMLGSMSGPAYLDDDESAEYAVGVSSYYSEDSEEERVGISELLSEYHPHEVAALYDVLMPHHRLNSAVNEYLAALKEYSKFDSDDFEEVALGNIDSSSNEFADALGNFEFGDSEDFDELAVGDSDRDYETFEEIPVGDPMWPDNSVGSMMWPNSDEESSEENEFVLSGSNQVGPNIHGESQVSSEERVSLPSIFESSSSELEPGMKWPGESSVADDNPTVTGQMDQQLPERSAAGAADAPANGAPSAATGGNIDTKQIVDAVKEAVKDASAIAMKALTEEAKKTNDPVKAAGDVAKVEVEKGTDPVTAAVEAAKAVVTSPGSPAMEQAKAMGKGVDEAVKEATDAAKAAAKVAIEAGATPEGAANAAAKEAVKAAEGPKTTGAASETTKAAIPGETSAAPKDTKETAKEELKKELEKTADPVKAAEDVAEKTVEKGKDPVKAAQETVEAVMKTPGNPVVAKALAEGKTEDQAIKEAKDEAGKDAQVAIDAGADPKEAAKQAAKKGIEKAENPETSAAPASSEAPASSDAPNSSLAAETSSAPTSVSLDATEETTSESSAAPATTGAPAEAETTGAATAAASVETTSESSQAPKSAKEELKEELNKTADPIKAAADVAKKLASGEKDPAAAAKEAAKAVLETPGNPALKLAEEGGKTPLEALDEVEKAAEKAAKSATDAGASPEKAAEIAAKTAIEEVEKAKSASTQSPGATAAAVQISTTKSAPNPPSVDAQCECQEDWTFKGNTYHYCDPRKPEAEKPWCYTKGGCKDPKMKIHESEIVKGEEWIHCQPSDKPGSCDCQDAWSFKDTLYNGCDPRKPESEHTWCYVKDAEDCVTAKKSELKGGQKFRKCIATTPNSSKASESAETSSAPASAAASDVPATCDAPAVPVPASSVAPEPPLTSTTAAANVPAMTPSEQEDVCGCKDNWEWEGQKYTGCDIRMPGAKRKWCYVNGAEKCQSAEQSSEFPNESWLFCDKCDCEETWSYEGKEYHGCDAMHPSGNRKWCYVWGREECTSAEPSNSQIGEAWKYCDPCDCAKDWQFKGVTYHGCDPRKPEHPETWCYVADPMTCTSHPKATVSPGQRWRQCVETPEDLSNMSTAPVKSSPPVETSSTTPALVPPQETSSAPAPPLESTSATQSQTPIPQTGAPTQNGVQSNILLEAKTDNGKASIEAPPSILVPPAGGPAPKGYQPPQPAAAAVVFHPPQPIASETQVAESD